MCVQSIWSCEARDAWRVLPEDHAPQSTMLEAPPDEHFKWLLNELLRTVHEPHPNTRQVKHLFIYVYVYV